MNRPHLLVAALLTAGTIGAAAHTVGQSVNAPPPAGEAALVSVPSAEPRRLPPDEPVTAELGSSGPTLDGGFAYDDWALAAVAGERFRIDLTSTDFDTYLRVGRMNGGDFVELASNDDARHADLGATDSRVTLISREEGDLIVRVTAFDTSGAGVYSLVAVTLPNVRTDPRGGTIGVGSQLRGVIDASDAVLDDDTPFQEWRFTAAAGDRFEILLRSDDFDTYLIAGRAGPAGFEELASNDDWGSSANGTDSRLVFAPDASGDYLLRVRPFSARGEGVYTLSLDHGAPIRSLPVVTPIAPGDAVSAVLEEFDARLPDDSPHQHWTFAATVGTSYLIEMSSTDFDTYLSVGRMEGATYIELDSNDDLEAGTTDSRLEFVAPESGEFVIRANSYFSDGRGLYRISLRVSP